MASRHPIPVMVKGDVGPDAQKVAPRFTEPPVVEFSAGKNLGEFEAVVKGAKQLRVTAAAGAGKSVRMPAELVRIHGCVVVHCVPSSLLAASLHRYLSKLDEAVPRALALEVVDQYPSSGIVYTSSATFIGQACRWAAQGLEPNVVLYMDECHESDGATVVIRSLRTAIHGVARYMESSATYGCGDARSLFAAARLPSKVSEFKVVLPSPDKWDLDAQGVPWSLKKLTGDILVFIDDDEAAAMLVSKYRAAGMHACRLTAKTPPSDFFAFMDLMESSDNRASAMMVDYSFRSGFTFPTVTRIIDFCKVRYCREECGKTTYGYRSAYSAEVYQTRNRGGRVAGKDCDYFRPSYEPDNILVLAEGVEAEMACIWRRMLGFGMDSMLKGVKFAQGAVPRALLVAMRGDAALSCYVCDQPWPGKAVQVAEPEAPSYIALDSPVSSVSSVSDNATGGGVRPPSVFSLEGDLDSPAGGITEEQFAAAHRKSVRVKLKDEIDHGPMSGMGFRGRGTLQEGFDAIEALRAGVSTARAEFVFGTYYSFVGHERGPPTIGRFPDGVKGVISAMGGMAPGTFLANLDARTKREALQRALTDWNLSAVRFNASTIIVDRIKERPSEFAVLDVDAYSDWLKLLRDDMTQSCATMQLCATLLSCEPQSSVREDSPNDWGPKVVERINVLLMMLHACGEAKSGGALSFGDDASINDQDFGAVYQHVSSNYAALAGRVNMRISGSSFRERVANAILGRRPVEVDVVPFAG